jgi:hypothetical protein
MTKSERKKIFNKLERWQSAYIAARDNGNCSQALAAAVDWLRAQVKLADAITDDADLGWADDYIAQSALAVAAQAAELCDELLQEIRK